MKKFNISKEQPQLDHEKLFEQIKKYRSEQLEISKIPADLLEETKELADPQYEKLQREVFINKEKKQIIFEALSQTAGYEDKEHPVNEDFSFINTQAGRAVLCDGMGGEGGPGAGAKASQLAVKIFEKSLTQKKISIESTEQEVKKALLEAVKEIPAKIVEGNCTLSAFQFIVDKNGKIKVVTVNIGDSPILMSDGKNLKKLSTEQTAWSNFLENITDDFYVNSYARLFAKDYYKDEKSRQKVVSKIQALAKELTSQIKKQKLPAQEFVEKKMEFFHDKTKEEVKNNLLFRLYKYLGRLSYGLGKKSEFDEDEVAIHVYDYEPGNLVFCASDGLTDNLTESEIIARTKKENIWNLNRLVLDARDNYIQVALKKKKGRAFAKPDDVTVAGFKLSA